MVSGSLDVFPSSFLSSFALPFTDSFTHGKRHEHGNGKTKKNAEEKLRAAAGRHGENVHTINLNLIQIAFAIMASRPIHNEKKREKLAGAKNIFSPSPPHSLYVTRLFHLFLPPPLRGGKRFFPFECACGVRASVCACGSAA